MTWPASRAAWDRTRQRVIKRDGNRCSIDGCPAVRLDVDHIVERHHGGSDDDSNLRLMCRNHHRLRHRRVENTFESAWSKFINELTTTTT